MPKSEILKLPQFCWARYIKEMQSPEYRIPASCGPRTNHYCGGLRNLGKVKRGEAVSPKEKESLLRSARQATRYTLEGTKDFPACPIRQHVESTLLEIDAMISQLPKR